VSESIEVVVALVGDPTQPLPEILPERFWLQPYSERQTVALDVRPDESVGDVLQRAVEQSGAPGMGARIAFYAPDDEQQLNPRRASPTVPLVDDAGRVTWRHYWYEPTYGELLRSGEAGALNGDPRRPYLLLEPGRGNGFLSDWPTILTVLVAVRYALGLVADMDGAASVVDRLRRKTRAASDVIEAKGDDWSSRNGDPYDVAEWLDDRPWLPADLVPLLGCTEDQAEAMLWAFGFAQADSGLWRRNADEEARLLGETTFAGIHLFQHADEEQMRRIVREELEHFLATGRARPALGPPPGGRGQPD